ncbi:hypothetical protein ADL12_11060 [Streptomyces regalis]|uniref:Uncharacterized protein n=1 Tax=Streptomyces regalis TaxID=68262 RepID=A0A0X3VAS3_9ACTN|nr:hypothetical protein ADL12_11060 [Streptomyces regalis]
MFIDEFGGGADEVGDDGEEALVDFFLRRVGQRFPFCLGECMQAVVVSGKGNRRLCGAWGMGDLFGEKIQRIPPASTDSNESSTTGTSTALRLNSPTASRRSPCPVFARSASRVCSRKA